MALPPLLERETELEALTGRVAAACRGEGSVALVLGPAGIGKTALVRAAVREARERGVRVLEATGARLERDDPYGVVRGLLGPAADELPGLLDGDAGEAGRVLRAAGAAAWDLGADPSAAVLRALGAACVALAARGPLLVAVDDAQWADDASLRLLAHLAARVRGERIALVAAAREEGAALAALAADPTAAVLRPAALHPASVAVLVRARLGVDATEGFATACARVTRGNPLHVEEVVRGLREEGARPDDATAERLAAWAPARVRLATLARARSAGPHGLAVAEAVVVLGADATLHHVALLCGLPVDEAALHADALAAAGVLTGELRPLRPSHPILATAVHDAIARGRRSVLHARAAALLASAHAPPERVAAQLMRTEPAGDPARAEALREAGRRAAAQGAPRAAVAHLRRALAEPPAAEGRAAVLLELGSAESYVGDPAAPEHLQAALDAAPDLGARLVATLALGRVLELGGHHGRAFAVLERAARDVREQEPALGVVLDAALLSAAELDATTAHEVPARADALRERLRSAPPPTPAVFGPLALTAAVGGAPVDEVVALARRALPADLGPLPEAADGPPFFYQAAAALVLGEAFEDARAHLERGLAHPTVRRSVAHATTLLVLRAWLHLRVGELAAARAAAGRALEDPAGPLPTHLALLGAAVLVDALTEAGDLAAAQDAAARVDADAPAARTSATRLPLLAARGRLALAQGRPGVAREHLAEAERHAQALHGDGAGAGWRAAAARAAAALGEPDEALRHAREELRRAEAAGGPVARGRALTTLAHVEGGDAALERLEDAVDALAGSGARLEHARALAALGAARRRAGLRRAAAEALREALDLAHRCGAAPLAQLARDELVTAGARPRRVLLRGPEALTASERRVAVLAAQGLTNREVGVALTLAPRTVEGHLTRVYGKLGIASRDALATALTEDAGAAPPT